VADADAALGDKPRGEAAARRLGAHVGARRSDDPQAQRLAQVEQVLDVAGGQACRGVGGTARGGRQATPRRAHGRRPRGCKRARVPVAVKVVLPFGRRVDAPVKVDAHAVEAAGAVQLQQRPPAGAVGDAPVLELAGHEHDRLPAQVDAVLGPAHAVAEPGDVVRERRRVGRRHRGRAPRHGRRVPVDRELQIRRLRRVGRGHGRGRRRRALGQDEPPSGHPAPRQVDDDAERQDEDHERREDVGQQRHVAPRRLHGGSAASRRGCEPPRRCTRCQPQWRAD